METVTSWNPLGHSRPVTGLLYLYLYDMLKVWPVNDRSHFCRLL